MSQAAVERMLGKLITDDAFRERFFTDPAVVGSHAGLELSSAVLDALSRLPKKALVQFSRCLDERIRRLPLDRDQGRVSADGLDVEAGAPPAESPTVIDVAPRARTQGVGGGMALPSPSGRWAIARIRESIRATPVPP